MTPQIITKAEREARDAAALQEKIKAELPSRWEMLKNLVQAAGQVLEDGVDQRTAEEIEDVLKICAECPKLLLNNGRARCGQCGCFLGGFDLIGGDDPAPDSKTEKPRWGKVLLKAWHCPVGKW